MGQWGTRGTGLRRNGERETGRERSGADRTRGAEEIERVVDVAERLGISPAVAAAALRGNGEGVRTDVPIEESIRHVERQLRRGA